MKEIAFHIATVALSAFQLYLLHILCVCFIRHSIHQFVCSEMTYLIIIKMLCNVISLCNLFYVVISFVARLRTLFS
jgi:hypothetical protein